MLKQIDKLNFNFNVNVSIDICDCKNCFSKGPVLYFYDDINKLNIITDGYNTKFLNKEGFHNLDGPAVIYNNINKYNFYFIKNVNLSKSLFAKETNHLICKSCEKFCKQSCF